MKRDKKKHEVKQKREATSAEITMRAKQGEGALTEDEDDNRVEDVDYTQSKSHRTDPNKK